jgi:hypothetical protein
VAALAGVFVLALVLSAWSKVVAVLLMAAVALGAVSQAKTVLTKIVGAVTGALLLLALIAVVWPGKAEKPRGEPPRQEPTTVAKAPASAPAQPVLPSSERAQVTDHPATADSTTDVQETPQQEKARHKEEQKRLKARHFISISPEALAEKLVDADPNQDEVFETKYQGSYVRWRGKYERRGIFVKFIASSGPWSAFSCKNYDPAQDDPSFDAARWEEIAVEGRLSGIQRQLEKTKTEFVLTECIARMAHQ